MLNEELLAASCARLTPRLPARQTSCPPLLPSDEAGSTAVGESANWLTALRVAGGDSANSGASVALVVIDETDGEVLCANVGDVDVLAVTEHLDLMLSTNHRLQTNESEWHRVQSLGGKVRQRTAEESSGRKKRKREAEERSGREKRQRMLPHLSKPRPKRSAEQSAHGKARCRP